MVVPTFARFHFVMFYIVADIDLLTTLFGLNCGFTSFEIRISQNTILFLF